MTVTEHDGNSFSSVEWVINVMTYLTVVQVGAIRSLTTFTINADVTT